MSKFNSNADEMVYGWSLDGVPETGDVQTGHHYSLVEFDDHDRDVLSVNKGLTNADSYYGAIVREDSQGFVDVSYFTSRVDLEQAWAAAFLAEASDIDEEV